MAHATNSCCETHTFNKFTTKYLFDYEQEWVKLQPFLSRRGYKLRPRFQPDWTPSWNGRKLVSWLRHRQEDYTYLLRASVIDAIRVSDNTRVAIKSVYTNKEELPLLKLLNSPEMRADRRNNIVEVFDILLAPGNDDKVFVVMPKLMVFAVIPFQYVCEVVEAFEQFLEGLSFLHEHNIAHRDACFFNLMLDSKDIAPGGFHITRPNRTENDVTKFITYKSRRDVGPVRYFIIDLGLSHRSSTGTRLTSSGRWGQDKTIPEFQHTEMFHDVFKVDVCQLGNVFRRIVEHYEDLSIFLPLVSGMIDPDPEKRLSAARSRSLLDQLSSGLTSKDLNRRIFYKASSKTSRRLMSLGLAPSEMLDMYKYLFPEYDE